MHSSDRHYTAVPYLTMPQIRENAWELARRMRANPSVWGEVGDRTGCFNCEDPSHRHRECHLEQGTFCHQCGTVGVIESWCPRCRPDDFKLVKPRWYDRRYL